MYMDAYYLVCIHMVYTFIYMCYLIAYMSFKIAYTTNNIHTHVYIQIYTWTHICIHIRISVIILTLRQKMTFSTSKATVMAAAAEYGIKIDKWVVYITSIIFYFFCRFLYRYGVYSMHTYYTYFLSCLHIYNCMWYI